jgi:hypothetical protein
MDGPEREPRACDFTPLDHGRAAMRMLPSARGRLSAAVLTALSSERPIELRSTSVEPADALADHDFHLGLYLLNELHYRGLPSVEDDREWDPDVVAFRRRLERAFEHGLRVSVPVEHTRPERVPSALRSIARDDNGPSLSRFMERKASLGQVREFLIHRSAYHLKEADPHSFAIPRLAGPAKAALAEIQVDEYGDGDPARMHSFLFAKAMEGVGLDPGYGAYLERIPGPTLATVNLMSLFGLHRRLRGALVGHLALFELTSTLPNRRYGNGLRRLGFGAETTMFFDEHVEADAVHEAIASKDMAGSLVEAEPELTNDVIFGAQALQVLEQRASGAILDAWERGATSLFADPKERDVGRVA